MYTLIHSFTYLFTVRSNSGDRCFAAAGPRMWNSLPSSSWS